MRHAAQDSRVILYTGHCVSQMGAEHRSQVPMQLLCNIQQEGMKSGLCPRSIRAAEVKTTISYLQEGYGGKISFVRPSGAQDGGSSSQQNGVSFQPDGAASPDPAGESGACGL